MTRLLITAASAILLILFVSFVASRLVRARTAGLSVRLQFFLTLGGIVGAFALGLGLLVLDRLEARTTRIAEGAALDEAEAIAGLLASEMETRGVRLEEVARRYAASGAGDRTATDPRAQRGLALLDPGGAIVFSSGLSGTEPGSVAETSPILVRGARMGSVRVVKPTLVVQRLLADFAPFVLVVSAVLGLAAALAAHLSGRAIAQPIEALTEFAVRVSEGERRAAPPPAHGREVQRLSRALDSMRRELEGRPFVETFAADLSHELKNPVAAIRASAEVLADGALEEPERAARFVARIQEATTRIETLLGDLLSLARIEARGVEEAVDVDLGEIAEEAAARSRERGANVDVEVSSGAIVRGDPKWLQRAVENLLENAGTHGEPGAKIAIEVGREGRRAILRVKNGGSVHEHVQKRLFRRFVTTRADRGGTGLGLAIVRAVAEAHAGSAECVTMGPPGVEFRLTFPLS